MERRWRILICRHTTTAAVAAEVAGYGVMDSEGSRDTSWRLLVEAEQE